MAFSLNTSDSFFIKYVLLFISSRFIDFIPFHRRSVYLFFASLTCSASKQVSETSVEVRATSSEVRGKHEGAKVVWVALPNEVAITDVGL